MSTATQPFLHVRISGEPEPGRRPRVTLMPTASADELLRRAKAARTIRDLFPLFRPHIPPPNDRWRRETAKLLRVERQRVHGSQPVAGVGEPIEIFVLAVFALPVSKHRKREPVARAWQISRNAGDFDNLAKPICDAANDALWPDDCQVARAVVEKIVGAQGEPPRLELIARRLRASPRTTIFEAVASGWERFPDGALAVQQELDPWLSHEEAAAARPPLPSSTLR